MMSLFRIVVGDKYYAGETSEVITGWQTDPWSGNSFQTGHIQRAALGFTDNPKKAKIIYDRTTLMGETRRIIEYLLYTDIGWHDIHIEREPFPINLKFDLEYLLKKEDEANRQSSIIKNMEIIISEYRKVSQMLADELAEVNSERFPISWEDASESSPAWIAYCNLRDRYNQPSNSDSSVTQNNTNPDFNNH